MNIRTSAAVFTICSTLSILAAPAQAFAKKAFDRTSTPSDERVLVIGASVAQGQKDTHTQGGYLRRAFHALNLLSDNHFTVIDKAVPGSTVRSIRKTYLKWLDTVQPNVVVIAWGGLNDLARHTPFPEIQHEVYWQIDTALKHHAAVILVTSPVSPASYTTYRVAQTHLFNSEVATAKRFHSQNVYIFNVFSQMKSYFSTHHEAYQPYMGDGWHPNAHGHELAAQLFIKDWSNTFGTHPIQFQA
ncbi:hypothetical protein AAC03nite_27120 [Alicyclobacillus acidoterrestris]|uniref:SGNH/GDSL hydrolase family protein n=1 Tax=Alicyclobacillus suci TaxID=2816080 RepID=UPI001196126A|nr:SGNH/GDSL hydrolase family protein [Alicyclobacillus suci]GEO26927.1 hypothetical protein AAC03nite_27120 [Alicyclobacillus acidoterrestris]